MVREDLIHTAIYGGDGTNGRDNEYVLKIVSNPHEDVRCSPFVTVPYTLTHDSFSRRKKSFTGQRRTSGPI